MHPADHAGRASFRSILIPACVLCFLSTTCAYGADGNELFALGALQKSTGGAGAASPKDSTWTLLNPAALVDLPRQADINLEWMHLRVDSEPRGLFLLSNPGAGRMHFDTDIQIPMLGLVWPFKAGTLGFGVYGVAGNRTAFHHPRATLGLLGNGDRRAAYEVAKFPLAFAHRFDNGWAVGGAIVPAFTRFRTDSLTLRLRPARGDNAWSSAFGCGFELACYRQWEKWGLGATYTSRTWMQNFPKYRHDLTTWSLDLPQKVQFGLAYRPVKPLELVLDYKWIDWNSIELFGKKTTQGGLNWRNQHALKFGASWDLNRRWTVRAGLSFANPAVAGDAIFANALTPAIASIHAGCGFSCKIDEHSSVHLAYSMAVPAQCSDNGRGDLFSRLGKGTKAGYQEYSLTAQYAYRF